MAMEIKIGKNGRVDAFHNGNVIRTAQDGTDPAPFDLFLAAVGTCTALYVARFCESRDIPTDGIRIVQRKTVDPDSRMVRRIALDVELPDEFPERYRDAMLRAAALCTVKKHLDRPPEIAIELSAPERV